MGLDTTHGAWHGAYSAFMTWRRKIAELAELPPLDQMEGYTDSANAIKWDNLTYSPLFILLTHSDCEGKIKWKDCKLIADELTKLLPKFPNEDAGGHIGYWKEKTQTFINGLLEAYNKKEHLEFH